MERGEPADDAALARAAKSGDRGAFAELYERFAPAVHGVLLAHAPAGEAHDLVQEVFLSALRSIETLEEPEAVGAWLFTIARNRARDVLKRTGRPVELDEAHEPAVEPEESIDDEQEAERVLDAIRSLPDAYRETLVLRLVECLPGPEIAARTGLTHGSVRINLHRGMKLLRERLDAARGGHP
jgi:RNA polymerase sigma-70 factor (ECF subfamily)